MTHHAPFPIPTIGEASPSSNTAAHVPNPTVTHTPSFVNPIVLSTPFFATQADPRPGTSVPSAANQGVTGDSELPEYRDDYAVHTAPGIPGSPSSTINEAAQARAYEESLSQFCATNRDLISPTLEGKLRAARYLPKDNPSEISAEYWRNTYGVEFFDLKRLQEAYEKIWPQKRSCAKRLLLRE
ncbi:hypothetical protein M408DRAFT_108556 [Serendipita vermifera MAFF 305830]|uniref:Uncharacterized protein n=1 Tax=Serendipita vermifera MAFF 305830 TaxID=933852 RepID=A0A0C3AZD1_SERVB|nr:hypothetical protein M408DRAFT_108556 [Serendipita vermifera MAFF 305830]